ncbi:unnamed protein product [Lactuca virosa]|nr:unnamed protein product [Lactuca virosa]
MKLIFNGCTSFIRQGFCHLKTAMGLATEGGRDFGAPCNCRGTSEYVHRHCLHHWHVVRVGVYKDLIVFVEG